MQLKDCLKEFLLECQIKEYTRKTIKGYRNGLEFLINYLKEKHGLTEIEEVTAHHLNCSFYISKKGNAKKVI